MHTNQYTEIAEALYGHIEEALDDLIENQQAPLDYENGSGVITIDCEDSHTQVIISRQSATQQIWVAAKSGGFHLDYGDDGIWFCNKTGESLQTLLSRVCTEQSNTSILLDRIDQ